MRSAVVIATAFLCTAALLTPRATAQQDGVDCDSFSLTQDVSAQTSITIDQRDSRFFLVTTHLKLTIPRAWSGSVEFLTQQGPGIPCSQRRGDVEYNARIDAENVVVHIRRADEVAVANTDNFYSEAWRLESSSGEEVAIAARDQVRVELRPIKQLLRVSWEQISVRTRGSVKVAGVVPAPQEFSGDGEVSWRYAMPGSRATESPNGDPLPTATLEMAGGRQLAQIAWSPDRRARDLLISLSNILVHSVAIAFFLVSYRRARRLDPDGRALFNHIPAVLIGVAGIVYGLSLGISVLEYPGERSSPHYVPSLLIILVLLVVAADRFGVIAEESARIRRTAIAIAMVIWVAGATIASESRGALSFLALGLAIAALLTVTSFDFDAEGGDPHAKSQHEQRQTRRAADARRLMWLFAAASAPLFAAEGSILSLYQMLRLLIFVSLYAIMAQLAVNRLDGIRNQWFSVPLLVTIALAIVLRADFDLVVGWLLPATTLVAVLALMVIMLRWSADSVIQVVGEQFLYDASSGSLPHLQEELVRAEQELRSLRSERRALDAAVAAGSISADERSRRLVDIDKRVARLRQLPPDLRPDPVASSGIVVVANNRSDDGGVNTSVHGGPRRLTASLPSDLRPIDVALAIGPTAKTPGNALRAAQLMLLFGAAPSAYFIYERFRVGGLAFVTGIDLLVSEAMFWFGFGLALGFLWTLLPAKRGVVKAVVLWTTYPVVVGVQWLLSWVMFDTVPPGVYLRGSVLLVALMLTGVLMDVMTVRHAIDPMQPMARYFFEYYRLNRLVPTLVVLVPLLASLLGIWREIDRPPQSVSPDVRNPASTNVFETASDSPNEGSR